MVGNVGWVFCWVVVFFDWVGVWDVLVEVVVEVGFDFDCRFDVCDGLGWGVIGFGGGGLGVWMWLGVWVVVVVMLKYGCL